MNTSLESAVADVIRRRKHYREILGRADSTLQTLRDNFSSVTQPLFSEENAAIRNGLNIPEVLDNFEKLSGALEQARLRFSRDTVNLGVAGLARQGKSRLLQSLSGLDDKAIPTSDGGNCTAVRSTIRYGERDSATLTLHTRDSLMDEVVKPYYEAIWGEGGTPRTLEEFKGTPLPAVPESATTSKRVFWDRLQQIHGIVKSGSMKFGGGEETVNVNDIAKYVTYDHGNAYIKVREACINTSRFFTTASNIRMIDLPGLNDITRGVAERMIRSLKADTDAVVLVRAANAQGGSWDENDLMAFDLFHNASDGLDLKHWCVVAMNLNRKTNNEKQTDAMIGSCSTVKLDRAMLSKCDCSNPDEVKRILVPMINNLLEKGVAQVDKIRIAEIVSAYSALEKSLQKFLTGMKAKSGNIAEVDSNDPVFGEHSEEFKNRFYELRGDMRDLMKKERRSADNDKKSQEGKFHIAAKKAIVEARNAFTSVLSKPEPGRSTEAEKLGLLGVDRLTRDIKGEGFGGTLEKMIVATRIALTKLLREKFSSVFGHEFQRMQTLVEETLRKHLTAGVVPKPSSGSGGLEQFVATIDENLEPRLAQGFEKFFDFKNCFNYDHFFLPAIRGGMEKIDFDLAENISEKSDPRRDLINMQALPNTDFPQQAKRIFEMVVAAIPGILNDIQSKFLAEASRRPGEVALSAMDEFVDVIIRDDKTRSEWRSLMRRHKRTIWPRLYEKADRDSFERAEWAAKITGLTDSLQNLSTEISQLKNA